MAHTRMVAVGSGLVLLGIGAAGCNGRADVPASSHRAEEEHVVAVATAPRPARPELTLKECADLGGGPVGLSPLLYQLGSSGTDLSRDDECPGSRLFEGTLEAEGDVNGGLCCEVPPSLTIEQCLDADGLALPDPGGGSSYSVGCREGESLVGWLTACGGPDCGEGGICCRPSVNP